MEWDELLVERVRAGQVTLGPGAAGELTDNAEAALGRLPDDYKRFLRKFGYASIGPNEIYGLGEGIPRYLDVVEMTLAEGVTLLDSLRTVLLSSTMAAETCRS